MPKENFDEWLQINSFVQQLSPDKRRQLYQELKSHGEVENPVQFTETHLEGGIEAVLENEADDKISKG